MMNKLRNILSGKQLKELETDLKKTLSTVREELDDHLDGINQNTNEIQSNYETLCGLDAKINKLNERVDELFLLFKQATNHAEPTFEVQSLTKREKEVFLALYTLEDEFDKVSYLDLARRLGTTVELVQSYIGTLVEKGIPILKRYISNTAYLRLDPSFKSVQAKENILEISHETAQHIISLH